MKRTRDEQNLCTSVRYQLKQLELNRTIRLPVFIFFREGTEQRTSTENVIESSLSSSCHPRIRHSLIIREVESSLSEEPVVFEESSSGCSNSPTRRKCARIEWEDLFMLDEKTLYFVNVKLYFNESLAKLSRVLTDFQYFSIRFW